MVKKSIVWKHFSKCDKDFAECRYCSKKLRTSGNTSNLMDHLKAIHPNSLETKDTTSTEPEQSENIMNGQRKNVELNLRRHLNNQAHQVRMRKI